VGWVQWYLAESSFQPLSEVVKKPRLVD